MLTRKRRRNALSRNRRGVSTIISTIIITGTLLIILVIASFVSANVLDMQIANTEFEQAKTNMLTLDETIQDVALRRGSGGYVQFNQRSGGIGINITTQKLTVMAVPNTLTLRPSAAGTLQIWGTFGSGSTHWDRTSDLNDATGVQTTGSVANETENLQDIAQNGTINSVTAYMRAYVTGNVDARIIWRTHNVSYASASLPITRNVLANYNESRTNNPNTVRSWTWTEINDLQIGCWPKGLGPNDQVQVAEFWIVVNFTAAAPDIIYQISNLVNIVYRGGSKVSGTDLNLSGNDSLIVGMPHPLGYVRVAVDNGLKIKLDYFRIRLVQGTTMIVGNANYNFTEITFIRIVTGTFGGSGTVNCQVQNVNVNTIIRQYSSNDVTLTVQLDNRNQNQTLHSQDPNTYTAIIFTEVVIQISIV